jgi:ComF family protein
MSIINDFVSLIYPRKCEACGNVILKHETFICSFCYVNLPRSNYHKFIDNELHRTFAGRLPTQENMAFYLFEKSGKVQRLLHHIKYENQKELAEFLGISYAQELLKDKPSLIFDFIVPIPLHENKLKNRGFNQSEYFAKGLSCGLQVPINIRGLSRIVESSTQTRKRKFQRWENVEGIFQLTDKEIFRNKHILLVDDVVTTGATIEAAWMAVKDVEGIKISVACIAFAARNMS